MRPEEGGGIGRIGGQLLGGGSNRRTDDTRMNEGFEQWVVVITNSWRCLYVIQLVSRSRPAKSRELTLDSSGELRTLSAKKTDETRKGLFAI